MEVKKACEAKFSKCFYKSTILPIFFKVCRLENYNKLADLPVLQSPYATSSVQTKFHFYMLI